MVWMHAITILILLREDGSTVLAAEQSVREVQHLTVTQVQEYYTCKIFYEIVEIFRKKCDAKPLTVILRTFSILHQNFIRNWNYVSDKSIVLIKTRYEHFFRCSKTCLFIFFGFVPIFLKSFPLEISCYLSHQCFLNTSQ